MSLALFPQLGNAIPVNVIMFAPAMLLGFIGGIFGAIFTIMNLKITRLRRRLISRIKNSYAQKCVRFLEPPIIMVSSHCPLLTPSIVAETINEYLLQIIYATITIFLPMAFPCKPMVCPHGTNMTLASNIQLKEFITRSVAVLSPSHTLHQTSTNHSTVVILLR